MPAYLVKWEISLSQEPVDSRLLTPVRRPKPIKGLFIPLPFTGHSEKNTFGHKTKCQLPNHTDLRRAFCYSELRTSVIHGFHRFTTSSACWCSQTLYDGNQPPPSLGSAKLFTLLSIAPTTRLLPLPTYNPAQASVFGSSLLLFYKLTLVDAGVKQVSLLSHTPTPFSHFGDRGFLSFQVD